MLAHLAARAVEHPRWNHARRVAFLSTAEPSVDARIMDPPIEPAPCFDAEYPLTHDVLETRTRSANFLYECGVVEEPQTDPTTAAPDLNPRMARQRMKVEQYTARPKRLVCLP